MSAPRATALPLARESIARNGRSFALASRLLPRAVRDDAVVLYAYCRRVDDAIDCAAPADQALALRVLHAEVDALYTEAAPADPLLAEFARVVRVRAIPRVYLTELLAGMAMDVAGTRYRSAAELLGYCYRVAGTVGLMMCHVMGVRRPGALRHAAHLGIAMQLTNIARDVLEDWQSGRLYLPDDLLDAHGAGGLQADLGSVFPSSAVPAVRCAIHALLERADAYYRSADSGLCELSPRCALGVRAARLLYAQIGRVLVARGCDPTRGRAVVGGGVKLWLIARALVSTLAALPAALVASRPRLPGRQLSSYEAIALKEGGA